jgi:hypothetical protein
MPTCAAKNACQTGLRRATGFKVAGLIKGFFAGGSSRIYDRKTPSNKAILPGHSSSFPARKNDKPLFAPCRRPQQGKVWPVKWRRRMELKVSWTIGRSDE